MDNTAFLTFPIPDRDAATQDDPFIVRNGLRYAGTHLLIDLWGGRNLDDIQHVDRSLRRAAEACGATVLEVKLHRFQPTGVSGVAVLAESHISIHTWPENDFAAIDIFVCGKCDPYEAVPVLRHAFAPTRVQLAEHKRGLTE